MNIVEGWNDNNRGRLEDLKKVTLSVRNPTWNAKGVNSGFHGEKTVLTTRQIRLNSPPFLLFLVFDRKGKEI